MNINTKRVVKQTLLEGTVTLENHAVFRYKPSSDEAFIQITKAGGMGNGAYFDANACREAAEFFTRMAHVLESK